MKIVKAERSDAEAVSRITQTTISEIYPKYYPAGAVDFFREHHSEDRIMNDIDAGIVYLLYDEDRCVGTVTVRENEICRLFVLPEYQHRGYGRQLLDFAENEILKNHGEIVLDASLPAKKIYRLRGYTETDYHQITTANGDRLCYDVMKK